MEVPAVVVRLIELAAVVVVLGAVVVQVPAAVARCPSWSAWPSPSAMLGEGHQAMQIGGRE